MITEISVNVPNEPGQLVRLLRLLGIVNIQAFTIEEGKQESVIRFVTNDPNAAKTRLRDTGILFMESELIAVPLAHRPGQLLKVAGNLAEEHINIEHGYLTVDLSKKKAVVLLRASSPAKAEDRLKKAGFELTSHIGEELPALATPLQGKLDIYPDRDVTRVKNILAEGESGFIEFKETMRYNLETGASDPGLGIAICKSIIAFMNTNGGVVLIGIQAKTNEIKGLERDFSTLGQLKTRDGFQLAFSELLITCDIIQYQPLIVPYFLDIEDKEIFVIEVYKSTAREVYFKGGEFYVRSGSSTRKLNTRDATTYINLHWRKDSSS